MLDAAAKNGKYALRTAMGQHRAPFRLLRLNATFRRRMVAPDTDLCLEGFPRSSNSFAYHAFLHFNPAAKVAHHLHLPMQVLLALDYGVPCVVLVRPPVDALASLLIVDRHLRDGVAIASYVRFHRRLADRAGDFVVADFEEVVRDFPAVVERVNRRYGTGFAASPITPELEAAITRRLEQHHAREGQPEFLVAVPTPEKDARKLAVVERLTRDPRLAEAQRLYEQFVAARERSR